VRRQDVGKANLEVARRAAEELWGRGVFAKTILC